MVGIIDPLRPSAKAAVQTALGAGIDVRMITGDHAVTAQAIGETLGLGPGAISGTELQALSDEELDAPAARAARLRPGVAGGQAAPRPADAGAGPDRRDDRRRGQRRCRAQAGRHRRGDGQRQRGHQAGRPDDPHRRQLRHARPRRRDRPPGLREGRLLRPLPDDPAAGARDAVHRRHRVQHQRGCGADPADGAVPALLRDRVRRRGHRGRSRRPRRHAPAAARPEGADHQPRGDHSGSSTARRCSSPRSCRSSSGPDEPSTDAATRVADDDVRGDGARHRLQRADQPPRPCQRALAADPQGAR